MGQISIVLPDGSKKFLPHGSTSADLAQIISPSLAKVVVAAKVDSQVADLRDPLKDGSAVELFKADSPLGIDTLRHSCEHILATAVCELFKGAQVTMGPRSHDDLFYYDFDVGRPFSADDLLAVEARMKTLIEQKVPFSKKVVSKKEAYELFAAAGQTYKKQIIDWIPEDQVSIYQCGDFIDLCRGPHLPHAGFIKAFKLISSSGSYWRGDSSLPMLQRISGIAFASAAELEGYLHRQEEAQKRDHRKLGQQLELFQVSERFNSYPTRAGVTELVVSGSYNESASAHIAEVINGGWVKQIQEIFSESTFSVSGFSLFAQRIVSEFAFDIDVRLYMAAMSQEQRSRLKGLEDEVKKNFPDGQFKINIETQIKEEIGPGLVIWLPKGGKLRTIIEDVSRKMHFEGGYDMVFTPHIAKSDLWKISGHWDFYRDSMFSPMIIDGHEYVLKPMNCPYHCLAYKNRPKSYRQLPQRLAEFGTVYRYELAGVMHGLMRVRGFTQDDAHIFCRSDQIEEEIDRVIGFVLRMLRVFGFSKFEVNLSTRPGDSVGSDAQWETAENALRLAIEKSGLPFSEDKGGGAFYGPKIDIKLRDCLDRTWQCSTIQLDFNNPARFDLSYTNQAGQKEQPVMIHRALFGSMERFVGVLIEHFAGAFPMWLAPEQIRIVTVADRHHEHAEVLLQRLLKANLRATIYATNDKLGAKIRQAQIEKIPVMLVVGDKEQEMDAASVRMRSGEDLGLMTSEKLVEYCLKEALIPDGLS